MDVGGGGKGPAIKKIFFVAPVKKKIFSISTYHVKFCGLHWFDEIFAKNMVLLVQTMGGGKKCQNPFSDKFKSKAAIKLERAGGG